MNASFKPNNVGAVMDIEKHNKFSWLKEDFEEVG